MYGTTMEEGDGRSTVGKSGMFQIAISCGWCMTLVRIMHTLILRTGWFGTPVDWQRPINA